MTIKIDTKRTGKPWWEKDPEKAKEMAKKLNMDFDPKTFNKTLISTLNKINEIDKEFKKYPPDEMRMTITNPFENIKKEIEKNNNLTKEVIDNTFTKWEIISMAVIGGVSTIFIWTMIEEWIKTLF